jgi:hypothetical protein
MLFRAPPSSSSSARLWQSTEGREIHAILDNLVTHKTQAARIFLVPAAV